MARLTGNALHLLTTPLRLAARRPWLATLVGVVALLGIAGGVGWWWWDATDHWRKAQLAYQQEEYPQAREHLAPCLKVWPNSPDVHLLAARVARRTGDLSAAETHLNRVNEIRGGPADDVRVEFLLIRVQGGEVDELAPFLFQLIDGGHPDPAEILDSIARAYSIRLRYWPAHACLSKWVGMEPENARPYYWRGWTRERLNNQKAASEDYHKAIELDPNHLPARLRIAEMLLEDKQAPEALPHLEHLLRQAPENHQVQARMGICLFLQGRGADARKLLEAAVVHLPDDPAVLVTLANLELQEERGTDAERGAKAERWLRLVLTKDPADTEALFVLVTALRSQGKEDEAAAALTDYEKKRDLVEKINELLKDKADNPMSTAADYAEIGTLFAQIGRDKLAAYWLEKALERDPTCQPAHLALAEYFERKGDLASADAHRSQVRTPTPKPPPNDPAPKPKQP